MKQVVLASGNAGKLKEFGQHLGGLGIELVPQEQFISQEVEETGLTFDALGGAPGIYSARYAGSNLKGQAKDVANCAHLIANLATTPAHQRTARFQCVLVYMRHASDPTPLICQAAWEGVIMESAQGDHGFGYDPIFQVLDKGCRAAQLTSSEKITMSHRGKALAILQRTLAEA